MPNSEALFHNISDLEIMSDGTEPKGTVNGSFVVENGDLILAVVFYAGHSASATINRYLNASLEEKLARKQNILTFDDHPTEGSDNPVRCILPFLTKMASILFLFSLQNVNGFFQLGIIPKVT